MGEVYRAWDARLGREVAVKVLPQSALTDPERLRRFEQEAKAIGALNHPNVLAVYDVGTHESIPYIVSELLEGDTLRGQIRAGGLTPRKAVEHAIQIARGLGAAHQSGNHPPRRQTGERLRHPRRPREGPGLRPRQAA